MKNTIALFSAAALALSAGLALAAAPKPHAEDNMAAAIGRLMQDWQSRILAYNLPVDDAKNWSRRNLARFSRLSAERLSLAQGASSLGELEVALLEPPVPGGTRLDVLMASHLNDVTLVGQLPVAKSSPATSPSAYSNLVFNALTPCRLYDSRISQGGPGTWTANSSNLIKVGPYSTAGGGYKTGPGAQGGSTTSCGLDTLAGPGQIAVIMAAVSTASQAGAGYLTFYPQGAPNPGANSVSQWYQPGYVQTSFVLIPTDLNGAVSASAFTSATTDVIIDVVGYFVAVAGNGNISLVASTATKGNILKGAVPFIHNFGPNNTFIGENAGNFTMSGFGNTAGGSGVLTVNSSGFNNTASGASALGGNTSGSNNTAGGAAALLLNSTGGSNTAIGSGALRNNTSGTTNTALGRNAGVNLTTGSFNIDIGNAGVADEASTTRIGDASQTRTFISGIRAITTDSADAIPVMIDSNGQLGTVSSSRRFKDDIADMDAASSALMKLRPVTFHYKSDQDASGRTLQYGLIAEEVAAIYPGLVAHSIDGRVETVMYQFLPPMLLNEIQKQRRTIERQADEIAALKASVAEIAELKREMHRLTTTLDRRQGAVTAGLGPQ